MQDSIASLIPDAGNQLHEAAARCLSCISCTDINADYALLPDGRFQSGMLRGYSQAAGEAGYIGASARKRNRERQLQAMEEQLRSAEEAQQTRQTELDTLSHRMQLLAKERANMPTTADLDQALLCLEQALLQEQQAKEAYQKADQVERNAQQQKARAEHACREKSAGLPYTLTQEAFEDAQNAADEYGDCLQSLNNSWAQLHAVIELAQRLDDDIAELRDDMDVQQRGAAQTKRALEKALARITELEAFLNQPENQDRARRLAQLHEEIELQEQQKQDAADKCARLQTLIENGQVLSERQAQDLVEATVEAHRLEGYFAEDFALSLLGTEPTEGSLQKKAAWAESKIYSSDRERTVESMTDSLQNSYQKLNNNLLKYQPKKELFFDAPAQPGMLRQRMLITLQKDGKELPLHDFIQALKRDIELTETVLDEKDRELFEDILADTISRKLRARIEESQAWSRQMDDLMKKLNTSMGLTFRLEWKPKKAQGDQELDTSQLVLLLSKDKALLTPEDSKKVSGHFRAKVKKARQEAEDQERAFSYADLIREVLDYRDWYEFQLYFQREGEAKKELTNHSFNKFSGGEKAMSIYLPQFAAVSAQYNKTQGPCPRLLALDEAFAGVDEKNISSMFELIHILDLDYIMNSQSLWGCYPCVTSLDIAEFYRPANAQVVTVLRYHWNGRERRLLE